MRIDAMIKLLEGVRETRGDLDLRASCETDTRLVTGIWIRQDSENSDPYVCLSTGSRFLHELYNTARGEAV